MTEDRGQRAWSRGRRAQGRRFNSSKYRILKEGIPSIFYTICYAQIFRIPHSHFRIPSSVFQIASRFLKVGIDFQRADKMLVGRIYLTGFFQQKIEIIVGLLRPRIERQHSGKMFRGIIRVTLIFQGNRENIMNVGISWF